MASSDSPHATAIADEVRQLFGCAIDAPRVDPDLATRIERYVGFRVDQIKGYRKDPPRPRERTLTQLLAESVKRAGSPIEEILAEAMINQPELARLFTPQVRIGPYRVDFGFTDRRYAVECDGYDWHRRDPSQIARDQARDRYLAKCGWIVRRFSGSMIWTHIEFCIDLIMLDLGLRGTR